MTIDLTKDEAQALMQLLDIATKAAGLQAAQAALPIAVKVQQSIDSETQEKAE